MDVRLRVTGGDKVAELMSLWAWLHREDDLRGAIELVEGPIAETDLGGALDAVAVSLGSASAGEALARALAAWLQARRSDVTVIVSGAGRTVEVSATNLEDGLRALEEALGANVLTNNSAALRASAPTGTATATDTVGPGPFVEPGALAPPWPPRPYDVPPASTVALARSPRRAVLVTALVVAVAALVTYSMIRTGDGGNAGDARGRETTTTSARPTTATTPGAATTAAGSGEVAAEVLGRNPPDPAPPPAGTPPDALEISTLIEGEGPPAASGDTVTVHYVGKLADGTVVDSSWERGTFPVTLGQRTVIAGWEEGLVGVRAGERRRLVMGSDKAYGPTGQDVIPPNAPLAFEIDVLDIAR